jgi:hypothetical protein
MHVFLVARCRLWTIRRYGLPPHDPQVVSQQQVAVGSGRPNHRESFSIGPRRWVALAILNNGERLLERLPTRNTVSISLPSSRPAASALNAPRSTLDATRSFLPVLLDMEVCFIDLCPFRVLCF